MPETGVAVTLVLKSGKSSEKSSPESPSGSSAGASSRSLSRSEVSVQCPLACICRMAAASRWASVAGGASSSAGTGSVRISGCGATRGAGVPAVATAAAMLPTVSGTAFSRAVTGAGGALAAGSCSSRSRALKTVRQRPQRTCPPATSRCSGSTRKRVSQWGHCVMYMAECVKAGLDGTDLHAGNPFMQMRRKMRRIVRCCCSGGQARRTPERRVQPSSNTGGSISNQAE